MYLTTAHESIIGTDNDEGVVVDVDEDVVGGVEWCISLERRVNSTAQYKK